MNYPTIQSGVQGNRRDDGVEVDEAGRVETERDDEMRQREETMQRMGDRLRQIRLMRNMTQGELAHGQYSVSYVSALERGRIRPSLNALERLADRLQVPVVDVLGDADLGMAYASTGSAERQRREEIAARLREAEALVSQATLRELRTAVDMLLEIGGATERSGVSTRGQESDATALTPRELAERASLLAGAYRRLGRGAEALRAAEDGLAAAGMADAPALAARLHFEAGNALALLGADASAVDAYRRCAETLTAGRWIPGDTSREDEHAGAAASSGSLDPALEVRALSALGSAYQRLGEPARAVEALHRAAERAGMATDGQLLGAIHSERARQLAARDEPIPARFETLRSIAALEEAGAWRTAASVHARLGLAYIEAGDVAAAGAHVATARALADAQGNAGALAEVAIASGRLDLGAGRIEAADAAAREALDALDTAARVRQTANMAQRAEALLLRAETQERLAQPEAAEQAYGEAIALLEPAVAADAPEAAEMLREAYARFSEFLDERGESKRALELLRHAYRVLADPHAQ